MSNENLEGRWVHTYDQKGTLQYFPNHEPIDKQGLIIDVSARNGDGAPISYMVQWYDNNTGSPTIKQVISMQQILEERWGCYLDKSIWLQEYSKNAQIVIDDATLSSNDSLKQHSGIHNEPFV